jgi:hypothetical protein
MNRPSAKRHLRRVGERCDGYNVLTLNYIACFLTVAKASGESRLTRLLGGRGQVRPTAIARDSCRDRQASPRGRTPPAVLQSARSHRVPVSGGASPALRTAPVAIRPPLGRGSSSLTVSSCCLPALHAEGRDARARQAAVERAFVIPAPSRTCPRPRYPAAMSVGAARFAPAPSHVAVAPLFGQRDGAPGKALALGKY